MPLNIQPLTILLQHFNHPVVGLGVVHLNQIQRKMHVQLILSETTSSRSWSTIAYNATCSATILPQPLHLCLQVLKSAWKDSCVTFRLHLICWRILLAFRSPLSLWYLPRGVVLSALIFNKGWIPYRKNVLNSAWMYLPVHDYMWQVRLLVATMQSHQLQQSAQLPLLRAFCSQQLEGCWTDSLSRFAPPHNNLITTIVWHPTEHGSTFPI